MAIQIMGNGSVIGEIESNTRAQRVVLRSFDFGSLGIYRASHLSGVMAAGLASDSEIFQFRWTHASNLALIGRVRLDGLGGSATAFAAGHGKIDMVAARGWSADGSGGTAMTITGDNQSLRTSMGTTLAGAIRGSSTAALTAGTKTLDAQPMGLYAFAVGTVVSVQYATDVDLFNGMSGGLNYPLVLAQNEGFVVRATVPATGTWQYGITVEWAEVTSY